LGWQAQQWAQGSFLLLLLQLLHEMPVLSSCPCVFVWLSRCRVCSSSSSTSGRISVTSDAEQVAVLLVLVLVLRLLLLDRGDVTRSG
jgi:hypothetical protein